MNLKLDELTKEELQKIIEKIAKRLSKEQYEYLQHLITECTEKENTAEYFASESDGPRIC